MNLPNEINLATYTKRQGDIGNFMLNKVFLNLVIINNSGVS